MLPAEPDASSCPDNGLAMSTLNVREYLGTGSPSAKVEPIARRFPTHGAENRIAAVLICEKEGFDELLEADGVPARYDLALMSTKGISAKAARELAEELGVPCFTLHDLDKNGFVMAGGFQDFATDLGLHLEDVEEWELDPEDQLHSNRESTYENLLENGADADEAEFIAGGQRVELNMFSSPDFVAYVEQKLEEHGVEKVVPEREALEASWERAHLVARVNRVIAETQDGEVSDETVAALGEPIPDAPDDLAERIAKEFEESPELAWDHVVAALVEDES
jgi:hypothetical protein